MRLAPETECNSMTLQLKPSIKKCTWSDLLAQLDGLNYITLITCDYIIRHGFR